MKNMLVFSLAALVVVMSGVSLYLYQRVSVKDEIDQPKPQEDVAKVLEEVGALIDLPEGETPTLATVSDPDRLKNQPFFAKAKAGDQVLIYAAAKKAVLYDPVRKKIIDVAPLNISANSGTSTPQTP